VKGGDFNTRGYWEYFFAPRRATDNCNCYTSIREGSRRHAKNCNVNIFIHGGPRRATENGNCNTFVREGSRRHAKNCNVNIFIHGGPRRATENGNCNTFVHEGPRRATKGHEERQLQHLFSTEGHRGRQLRHFLSTEGHEGPPRTAFLCPRRKLSWSRRARYFRREIGRGRRWCKSSTTLIQLGTRLAGPVSPRSSYLVAAFLWRLRSTASALKRG